LSKNHRKQLLKKSLVMLSDIQAC